MRISAIKSAAFRAAVFFLAGLCVQAGASTRVVMPGPQSLQQAIVAAAAGDVLELSAGTYAGPVVIDRQLIIRSEAGAIIDGAGIGTVITVAAPDVIVQGLTVINSGSSLSAEDSGIYVTAVAERSQILANRLQHNLIGIYLKGPSDAKVLNNSVLGRQDLRMNERGNGIQLWNSPRSIVADNELRFGRDGIFVNTSRDNLFLRNRISDLRFAIHYMYTNHSTVSDNISIGNDVGYALMYSTALEVRGNISLNDRDRGVFFNFTNESVIAGNIVKGGPEKCVFIYNSNINEFFDNYFQGCQIGIHFTAGSEQNVLWGNSFVGNRTQVKYVGTRQLEWSRNQRGNYWSDHIAFDLDGDGVAERPYQPNNLADQIIWRNPMAKILVNSPTFHLLKWAQSEFPALHPGGVQDSWPLMSPGNSGAIP